MPRRANARCPFFCCMSYKDKKQATITCQPIDNNLGFLVRNQIVFESFSEQRDFAEIFCKDMYDTCPYYKKLYKGQGEDASGAGVGACARGNGKGGV